jgi:hypothetical protein
MRAVPVDTSGKRSHRCSNCERSAVAERQIPDAFGSVASVGAQNRVGGATDGRSLAGDRIPLFLRVWGPHRTPETHRLTRSRWRHGLESGWGCGAPKTGAVETAGRVSRQTTADGFPSRSRQRAGPQPERLSVAEGNLRGSGRIGGYAVGTSDYGFEGDDPVKATVQRPYHGAHPARAIHACNLFYSTVFCPAASRGTHGTRVVDNKVGGSPENVNDPAELS